MRYSIAIEPQIPECHVEIHCSQVNREVEGILQALVLTETTVAGQAGAETRFIPVSQVLYFESVDDKTYLYTHDEVLSCDLRLYQITEKLDDVGFVRISKSVVANLHHMYAIRRERNRTLTAEMSNGERVQVSRTYLQEI
ncbi:MAG: LytTR family transcriptional regulator, partial [Clostridia bacterium]|nr:LytTR family transcriptional regulator [Clostridia bacterium]